MKQGTKLQILNIYNHSVAIIGVIFIVNTQQYNWLWIGLLSYFLIGIFSANISMHRYLSHKSFKTGKIRDIFLKYISILCCFGSPISWCALHRHHHAHSDTDNDIQNPKVIGKLKSWFAIYPNVNIKPKLVGDLLQDSHIKFIHKNYFKIIIVTSLCLVIINPLFYIFAFVVPAVLCFHGAAAIGVIPHLKSMGYKIIQTKDDSVNSPLASILSLGEGWHNYHHAYPHKYQQGTKWWEIDPSAFFIKHLFSLND